MPLGQQWSHSEVSCGQRSSTQVETMVSVQLRADLEALVMRLSQDMRKRVPRTPKAATAPLVDTRTIGKAPNIHRRAQGPERSFPFTAHTGSADPKSIEALRWAALEENTVAATAVTEQSFEEHNPQLYFALALLCKESALVTVKNTEFNNGPESWRALTCTYESNNEGRQRVRMQYLLQTNRLEPIAQATEAVERWECDVREYEQRFQKMLDADVTIGVTLALAPSQVQNHFHLKSYVHVRTMLFEYWRAQTDLAAGGVIPMDPLLLGRGKNKKGEGDREGKSEGKGKKGGSNKGERGKDEHRKRKGIGKVNGKTHRAF